LRARASSSSSPSPPYCPQNRREGPSCSDGTAGDREKE
jgi:hypothetical protein